MTNLTSFIKRRVEDIRSRLSDRPDIQEELDALVKTLERFDSEGRKEKARAALADLTQDEQEELGLWKGETS